MRRWTAALLLAAAASIAVARDTPKVAVDVVGTRVHIPVSVNGAPPATFILDTGAVKSPIDPEYATTLGIRPRSKAQTQGAGGTVTVGVAPDVTMTFAGARHRVDRSPMTPLGAINLRIGQPVAGILGYDVLNKYVTEIDYANETVVFHPKSFSPPAAAVRLPMKFSGHLPLVDVLVTTADGREVPGRFLVDTGAGMSFVVTRLFARKHGIEVENGIDMSLGFGVGGATQDRIGRLPSISVGGFRFERPVVNVSRDTKGVLVGGGFDGLIGGALLRRFTLYVDYGRKQFALIPNAKLREPFDFDMSGLQLVARDAKFDAVVVHNVLPGSPAEEAGIRNGDQLRAIDGKPALPAEFDVIRNAFKEPGKRFELTIVRDGAESVVPLTTRRML
jgi:predicted aspartyl protease